MTEHIIEILCHIELYRRRTVEVAQLLLQQNDEISKSGQGFTDDSEEDVLRRIGKAELDEVRRQSYWTIVLTLARAVRASLTGSVTSSNSD